MFTNNPFQENMYSFFQENKYSFYHNPAYFEFKSLLVILAPSVSQIGTQDSHFGPYMQLNGIWSNRHLHVCIINRFFFLFVNLKIIISLISQCLIFVCTHVHVDSQVIIWKPIRDTRTDGRHPFLQSPSTKRQGTMKINLS